MGRADRISGIFWLLFFSVRKHRLLPYGPGNPAPTRPGISFLLDSCRHGDPVYSDLRPGMGGQESRGA